MQVSIWVNCIHEGGMLGKVIVHPTWSVLVFGGGAVRNVWKGN